MTFNPNFDMIYDLINKVKEYDSSPTTIIVMNEKTSEKIGEALDEIKRTMKVKVVVTEYVEDDIVYALPEKKFTIPKLTFYEEDKPNEKFYDELFE